MPGGGWRPWFALSGSEPAAPAGARVGALTPLKNRRAARAPVVTSAPSQVAILQGDRLTTGVLDRRARAVLACALAISATLGASAAHAATPASATVSASSNGQANTVVWKGSVHPGAESGSQDEGLGCYGADNKPGDSTATGCDIFTLDVKVPKSFYSHFVGGPQVKVFNFGGGGVAPDIDFYVYKKNLDGTADLSAPVASGATENAVEQDTIVKGSGSFYVTVVPFATGPTQSYDGQVKMVVKHRLSIKDLNARAPKGQTNYRASHDNRISHSEPTITMDPLNHNHLIAGSKQYDNLAKYLFKIGAYESFDGGKHWKDWNQLPGYCDYAGACDPNQPSKYHVTSDISMTMDDEGNAYAFVLDSPGGVSSASGWGMSLNTKHNGAKSWSQPIHVHSNSANPVQDALFLDDKNWIAIDNNHTPDGGPNKPRDGKIGPLYTCWGLDQGSTVPVVPAVGQSIVFMRSTDGGKTWGGVTPGDNSPIPLSQKGAVSGIGCDIIVAKDGTIYVTWYDNQLDAIMQVKSIDFGRSFTPAAPIATISGQNTAFPGQAFRNLSIPTTGVDPKGNVYVAVMSQNGNGAPVVGSAARAAQKLLQKGQLTKGLLRELVRESGESLTGDQEGGGDPPPQCPSSDTTTVPCTDVIMFKSTDGGMSYSNPVRVNQDNPKSAADQFQPWMAITSKGQLDISYFDRRNDPNNYYIDTYLSRSNDGGAHFFDTRVTHSMWDPAINPPISPSGQFIGDYQGIVADDKAAVPFWNDTQYSQLSKKNKEYSPWQEVSAARVPNTALLGGPGACNDRKAPKSTLKRKQVHPYKHQGRLNINGRSSDKGCGKAHSATAKGHLRRVYVSVARLIGNGKKTRCSFLNKKGHFTKARSCKKPIRLRAKGGRKWHANLKAHLTPGRYRVSAVGLDQAGNLEKPSRRNTVTFRVR